MGDLLYSDSGIKQSRSDGLSQRDGSQPRGKDCPLEESCTGQKQSALVPLLSSVVSRGRPGTARLSFKLIALFGAEWQLFLEKGQEWGPSVAVTAFSGRETHTQTRAVACEPLCWGSEAHLTLTPESLWPDSLCVLSCLPLPPGLPVVSSLGHGGAI